MIETQPNNDAKMTLTLSTSSEEELRSSDVVESAVESHVEMQVADGVANAAKELGDKRELLNSTQSTKNTVITAIKSCCIQGAVLSAKRSSGARPRCGSVAPRRDYVI